MDFFNVDIVHGGTIWLDDNDCVLLTSLSTLYRERITVRYILRLMKIAAYAHWLYEAVRKYKVSVHTWVFTTNHIHLLVTPMQKDMDFIITISQTH